MSGLVGLELTCTKRDRVLFDNLQFSINHNELVYLRGPNGAGKTSLLRILTGLSKPDSGAVMYKGVDIAHDPVSYQESLIYIGHKAGLSGAFSALENLHFWCAQHGVKTDNQHIFAILDSLGLVLLEDVPVRFLSAGQQRRVALARLWLKPASIWILDEPFTALDVDGVALLETAFAQHVSKGGAVLTTSHQPLSALAGDIREFDLEYRA